jgi:hypothetical protein
MCGVCGRRMRVQYHQTRERRSPTYLCPGGYSDGEPHLCQSVTGRPVDAGVIAAFLEAASPLGVEISLRVLERIEQDRAAQRRQWELQVEQARYEARLAQRRYEAIEREVRRVVAESQEPFRGVRPDGRDHLPITTPVLCEAFASLTLLTQRLRVGDEVHDVVTPTTLSWVQQAILDRLGLDKPDAYLHLLSLPNPPEGCGK